MENVKLCNQFKLDSTHTHIAAYLQNDKVQTKSVELL